MPLLTISGEQADRASRGDREQMAVADATAANLRLEALGQAPDERSLADSARASNAGNAPRSRAKSTEAAYAASRIVRISWAATRRAALAVISAGRASPAHRQSGDAETERAVSAVRCSRWRSSGKREIVDDVVQESHRHLRVLALRLARSSRACGVNGARDEGREIERAEIAGAEGGRGSSAQGLVALRRLAVGEIVLRIDAVDEQHAGFGALMGAVAEPRPTARARAASL